MTEKLKPLSKYEKYHLTLLGECTTNGGGEGGSKGMGNYWRTLRTTGKDSLKTG